MRLLGSRWYLLTVLTLVGTVNWADRQVVPILFPGIRRDLGLNDTELGILGGLAFSLIYAASAFAFGYAADRYRRKYVVAFGLALWSFATAAGGLATGFWGLFAARFFTGIGEASLYPCALSLIGERFPAPEQGRALGLFSAAPALGSGLGVGLGGRLSESLGWQPVFFIYGSAGLLLIPILWALHEDRRARPSAGDESTVQVLRELTADRRLRWIWGTGTLAMAVGQGFAAWAPSYFVRDLGYGVPAAGALFGAAGLLGGIFGGYVGGTLADRQRKRRVGGELDVSGGFAFASFLLLGALLLSGRGAGAIAAGLTATFAIYAIFPGLLAAVLSLAPLRRHGAAGAVNTVCLGGVGAATGPFVVGAISDGTGSLRAALFVPSFGFVTVALLATLSGGLVRRTRTVED